MRIRLLALPFDSVLVTATCPISRVDLHVGPTIRLTVEPDDVDHADLLAHSRG